MSIWYALCEAMHLEFLHMTFMKNALLAVLILAPLFGLLSTMIVTGRMSFFSDALGHSVFTGIAVNLTDFYAMTAPLGSSDREMVEYALRTAVDAAQYLGAPLIHVPPLHALKSEVRTDEGLKNTAEMQLRQFELVDRENYGIYFDTQNPHALNGLDAPSLIEPIFNHIPEFHIKDGFDQISTHLIGEGSCDPFRSLAEFDRLGYTGWIILENYFWRVPLCQRGDDPYALLRRDLDTVRTWLAAHA